MGWFSRSHHCRSTLSENSSCRQEAHASRSAGHSPVKAANVSPRPSSKKITALPSDHQFDVSARGDCVAIHRAGSWDANARHREVCVFVPGSSCLPHQNLAEWLFFSPECHFFSPRQKIKRPLRNLSERPNNAYEGDCCHALSVFEVDSTTRLPIFFQAMPTLGCEALSLAHPRVQSTGVHCLLAPSTTPFFCSLLP